MFDGSEVAVIDAFMDWPRYSKRFNELFGDDIQKFKAMEKEFPEDPEAVIISGSTSGIYEDEEWIEELVEKTTEYIEQDIPVLGLCFGHQVIAKAMGATIEEMGSYEIGYKPVELDQSDIFQGLSETEYPFSTHQDRVVELPEELEPIARTNRCNQAIEHAEKPVYGVQFHPELTPEVARKAVETKDIEQSRKEELLQEINEPNFERAKRTLRIIENFLHEVQRNGFTESREFYNRDPGLLGT